MIRIFVNNIAFYIKKDISVLEALSFLGIRVPRFCYHEALSIAGNCRICLVETDSSLKLVASCAQPIMANMQIFSNTVKILKTRENIMESLLINHPLDCPICDQAGECDLQDQSKVFGGILSRNIFPKRGVENKNIDPCIKTIMTRCIHCTRCVRFAAEITGKTFLGTLNRGRNTEIGGFINHFQDSSEVSGNVIDLCPVGALTAKPYAFRARPWELRSIETIDLTDGLGSNLFINLKELEIINVLPKTNPTLNGQWISNKARFSIDAMQRYRISSGFTKKNENNKSISVAPNNLINKLVMDNKKMTFVVNDEVDMNSLRLLKKASLTNPSKLKVYNTSNFIKPSNYYYNHLNKISNIHANNSNCFVLLATNIRMECAVINIKLRIKAKNKRIKALSFGQRMEPNYPINFINITPTIITSLIEGKNHQFSKLIFVNSNPTFLIGEAFFQRISINKHTLVEHLTKYNSNNSVYVINKKANTESLLYLNVKRINSNALNKNNLINFCGLDDSLTSRLLINNKFKNSAWLHTHGSEIATKCTHILPLLSYLEVEGVFLNLEMRPQKSTKIIENGGNITYSLIEFIQIILTSYNIKNLSNKTNPFAFINEIVKNPALFNNLKQQFLTISHAKTTNNGFVSTYPYKPIISDYYLTNSYSKYSLNMINYSNKKKTHNNIFLNLPI